MDSKKEQVVIPETILAEANFNDPKITRIDEHIHKRKQDSNTSFSVPPSTIPVNTNSSEIPLICHPAFEKKRFQPGSNLNSDDIIHPDSIFSNQPEDLDRDVSGLEQALLEKIRADLDPSPVLKDIENIPAYEIQEELKATSGSSGQQGFYDEEEEQFEKIKHWLEDKPQQKAGLSNVKVAALGVGTAAIGVVIGGLLVSWLLPKMNTTEQQNASIEYDQKIEDAYQAYKATIKATQAMEFAEAEDTEKKRGGPGGGGISGAAIGISIPVTAEAIEECKKQPEIKLAAAPAGKTRISISSQCRAEQKVVIQYAELKRTITLDKDGKHSFILDCFAGDQIPINFLFADQIQLARKPVTQGLEKITKVAIMWNGAVDLNLHAFEYMANHGDSGHIWEKQPSDYKKAQYQASNSGRGHGFISAYNALHKDDTNLEVYTFINTPQQKSGVIKLALNHQFKKQALQNINCHTGSDITVDYTTTVLVKNRDLKTGRAASVLNPCNSQTGQNRLNSRAIQDLIVGR